MDSNNIMVTQFLTGIIAGAQDGSILAARTFTGLAHKRPPLAEMSMKVHFESNANASLPLILLLTEHDTVEIVTVGLAKSEGMGWEHVALDPDKCVPILEHGDFVLTKDPAILQYLEAPPVPGPRLPPKATSRLGRLASLALQRSSALGSRQEWRC
jgi:hypothetical protein